MKRYLVTSADEKTWPIDKPILFLGVWCKVHSREHVWSKFDWEIAKPHLRHEDSLDDNIYLESLFDELLNELTSALNIFHEVNFSSRYWNILLGHWLRQFLQVTIHRYRSLNIAINNNDISGVSVYKSKPYALVTESRFQFLQAINNSKWNGVLISRILSSLDNLDFSINQLNSDEQVNLSYKKENVTFVKKLVKFLFIHLNRIYRENDAFIIKSYLPIIEELKLHLNLFQMPKLWQTPQLDYGEVDPKARESFSFDCSKFSGFENLVRKLIIELLPTCYLEGYKKISFASENFPWPKNPKFIFTSNSFEHDEGFKFWTAKKVENGTPYFVGQHGSNYGTYKYSFNWTELSTCDKFISWGWDNVYKNIDTAPAFNFLVSGMNDLSHSKSGSILLIERGPGQHDGPYDRRFIHKLYQNDMLSFFNCFSEEIKEEFIVRLHHGSTQLNSDDEQLWRKHYENIQLSLGNDSLKKLVSKSRIVVITYDSTSILEYLSLNIPIVAFWKDCEQNILMDAVPYYKILFQVGILHKDYKSAASHIQKNWHLIDNWWTSNKVQHARKEFCNRYSKKNKKPAKSLSKILLNSL